MKKNISILKKKQPDLARQLRAVSSSGSYAVEPARTGSPALFFLSSDGGKKTLHSSYDPVREAVRFVESLPLDGALHFLAMGLGLGYHLLELVERVGSSARILIVEKNLEVVHLAFSHRDLTPLLAHPGVRFAVAAEPEDAHAVLGKEKTAFGLHGHVPVEFKPLVDVEADYYASLRTCLDKTLRESRMDLATKSAFSKSFYRNLIANWGALLSSPGITQLADSLAGVPCVVVAAGPSLDKNVALLKSAEDKALIITVATALKALKNAGIRPDFVMANDPDPSTLRAFGAGPPAADLWLVYDPCVPKDIVESFAGRRLTTDSGVALSQWLSNNHLPRGSLGTVYSVAHAAFLFARHLGCTPVIFTGQDLAFDRTRLHCSGSFYDQGHRDRVNEMQPVQMLEREKFQGFADSLGTLSDVFGHPAATTLALDTYRNRFAEAIGGAADVINATEGGIPIPGIQNLSLREALTRHCGGSVRQRKKAFLKRIAPPPCPAALIAALENQAQRLRGIHEKVLALRKEFAGSGNGAGKGSKQEFVRQAEALYRFMLEDVESVKLMQGYLYAGFAQWNRENTRLMQKENDAAESEILNGKADRDRAFLPVLEEASGFLAEAFTEMAEKGKRKERDGVSR